MSPSADLNLLFGIIALQTNFITRAQLVAAFDAWVEDKSRDLAQILVATKALTTEGHDALTRLVALFLEKHGGDAERSLAAMSSISLVKSELERLGDPDLGASLGHVAQDVSDFVSLPTTADVSPGLPGRFRILRPHAKGGLGQVSVALDQELHREVALKEILTQHSDDPTARERFVLEAEITGGLEHPGIVPVYALGQSADGRPFYAMRFVKGDSLKQAIEQFHRPDNPNRKDAGTWQLELRQLLGRFIDVCNAMEYAHSRGVLHRDLKPGNIMVGKYGETLVVDWGLAKAMGTREIGSDDAPLCPSSSLSSSVQTQPGSAIGTPAYMSPEQAAGKLDDLGPATDVYSLGATLYHLLCGRPPFEKEHLGELLRKVQKGEFARPRMVAPEIPRSLEAICLKAMQSSPADRYPTARALADDIEHWLADEPISASTDTASERISRWGRKHRTVVQAGGISLVVIAGVAIVAAFWINQERDEKARLADEKTVLADEKTAAQALEREARIEAENHLKETQRTLAQVHFERGLLKERDGQNSESLVDFFLAATTASEDSLIKNAYQRVLLDRLTCQYALVSPPLFHDDAVLSVAFSLDGTRVVTGSSDNTARLWDAQTGAAVGDVMKHDDTVSSVAFSPDGTRVVTASWGGTARLWDAQTGAAVGDVMKHGRSVDCVAFRPDGKLVVTGSSDKTARLWDAQRGVAVGDVMKHDGDVYSVAFSPDGTRVVTGSEDKTARLWDAQTGVAVGAVMKHGGIVSRVAFSPDGMRVVTGSRDHTARLWNARTGTAVGDEIKHKHFVYCVAFSPSGMRVATGSGDNTARLWDAQTGAAVGAVMKHDDTVLSVAFSPDGTLVVTGSSDNTARLWDAQTGVAVGDVMKHDVTVSSVAFSPDGTRVVTGSWDKTARLWDARTGAAVGAVMKHHDIVSNVAFSPDGTRVLTESEDKTARLWDAQTGVAVGDVMKHDRHVNSVAFSPDGTRVATGSSDNTARLWDVSIPPPGDDSRARLDLLFELMTGCRITSERTGQTVRIPAQELFAIRRRLGDDDPLLKFQRERFARLATSHIPAAETPIYLTKKRQQRNVLRNSSFDDVISDENWVVTTYLQNEQVASRQEQVRHGGTHSVQFETAEADDARLLQNVVVKPNTEYLLSGWIKTQDVFITQDGGRSGASLAIEETHQSTASVIATKDWTYVTLQFNSGDRTELHLGPRLGHFGSTCTGTAWFDDLCLIEMFPQEADESE